MWLNKDPDTAEHEYIVIETRDREDGKSRLFILDRMSHKAGILPDRSQGEGEEILKKPNLNIVTQVLAKFPWLLYLISPSRSISRVPSLESMEEGTFRPTSASASKSSLFPFISSLSDIPRSLPDSDTVSLSATNVARSLSDSVCKGSERAANDRLQGENAIFGRRYAFGQNARWIKPKELSLFELVILAEVVHNFAPEYTTLKRNCFWFCNIIFDSISDIFRQDDLDSEDGERAGKFGICQRWKGFKVTDTDAEELSKIAGNFRAEHRKALNEVKFVF